MTWIEATILRPLLFSFSRSSPALVSAHQPPANPCLPTCKSPILRPSSALRIPSAQVAIFGLLCSFQHFGVLAFVNLDLLVWISKILILSWILGRKCDCVGNFWTLQFTRVLLGPKIFGSQRSSDLASSNPIETSQVAAQFSDGHLHIGALDSLMASF